MNQQVQNQNQAAPAVNAAGKNGLALKPPVQFHEKTPKEKSLLDDITASPPESPSFASAIQKKSNTPKNETGMPDQLKSGLESLSGMDLGDINVHYNSPEPAQLQAHAFAQGNSIHIGPGQEKHLGHEGWHVVQQRQGRVKPTLQLKSGIPVNDDAGLEAEADRMGALAWQVREPAQLRAEASAREASPVYQLATHAFIGTMIHHAPPADLGDTTIDPINEAAHNKTLNSRRGAIMAGGGDTFDWDFATLAEEVKKMRDPTGLSAAQFPVVVNANWMQSPGYTATPAAKTNVAKGVTAFGTNWGMSYLDADAAPAATYAGAIASWKEARDHTADRGVDAKLGEAKSKKLLRTSAKKAVARARNEVIPHRGLRNEFFKNDAFNAKLDELEAANDYVHIMTLDSDVSFTGAGVINEIKALAEDHLASGDIELDITATDYVYDKADLFEWFVAFLDKAGRKLQESHIETPFDAYPAEPGLTISYSKAKKADARRFLGDNPFGVEESGKPTKAKFNKHVKSKQSVEGKNIRQKWRKDIMDDDSAQVNRTTGYLKVKESDAQARGHGPTLQQINASYKKREPIKLANIQTLINGDTYHSLNAGRKSETHTKVLNEIVVKATDILNAVLAATHGKRVSFIKSQLESRLSGLMDSGWQLAEKEDDEDPDEYFLDEEGADIDDEYWLWYGEIDKIAMQRLEMGLEDLSDAPFRDGFEADQSPQDFYNEYFAEYEVPD